MLSITISFLYFEKYLLQLLYLGIGDCEKVERRKLYHYPNKEKGTQKD